TIAERMRVMAGGVRLLSIRRNDRARLERMAVAELMHVLGQGERARAYFWYPLSIATLNDEPELSSAALLAEVLKRAFFSRRADSAFVYSRVGLSDLYCAPAAAFIERHGGAIVTHSNVEAFELAGDTVVAARFRDGRRIEAPRFICAVRPDQLLRLLP